MNAPAVVAALNRVEEPTQQQEKPLAWLAALYAGLAEALAADTAVPAWLGRPGREWPVWEAASRLAACHDWPAMSTAVMTLAEVSRASPAKRQSAYEQLRGGNGRAPLMLYESQYVNGRFLGPETFALQALYREVGLEIVGAELPDHAAIELEFLSFLAEQEAEDVGQAQQWYAARRRFLKQHAGRWLPQVGRRLAAVDDPAWSAIGQLLTAVLTKPPKRRMTQPKQTGLPRIANAEACNLCSFCVQVCPTRALRMQEDDQATRLHLQPNLCIHCCKCEQACPENALDLLDGSIEEASIVLRESPRAVCPRCSKLTVSQAELAAVAVRLGHHPTWLDYCMDCRAARC